MVHSKAWVSEQGQVFFFEEDPSGTPIGLADPLEFKPETDTPLFKPCLHEDTSISGQVETTRRPVTGRTVRKIVRQAFEYQASISYLYADKETELLLLTLFARTTFFTMVFTLLDGVTDQHFLRRAVISSFDLQASTSQTVILGLSMEAEGFD